MRAERNAAVASVMSAASRSRVDRRANCAHAPNGAPHATKTACARRRARTNASCASSVPRGGEILCASASAETPPALPFRVGHGFDLHRLESVDECPDLKLIIGGIEIPHDRGCVAHSDGDVLMHCVVDAITGALGLPDIGQLFPDTDPKWKGQTSDAFVREAVRLMELEGYAIGNLDCTLIAQRPKISPLKDSIRANVAKVLGVHESVVNVKAKTHEKVDSLGENRSIACHTVIMLIRA